MDSDAPEVKVTIPQTLRALCSGNGASQKGVLSLNARSVRMVLQELARQHPQVHVRVCDERGEPRQHINVFVNNDHVRVRDGLDTLLNAGDQVSILPAVSGG